jgi:aspartate aminotransferase-like enzyme
MLKEGMANIFARHARLAKATREGVKALGLPPFAEEGHASNTVTSVAAAGGLDIKKMRKILNEEYGVVLAGGQQKLDGKIFRIGHLGWVNDNDIKEVLAAIKKVLPQAGFRSS